MNRKNLFISKSNEIHNNKYDYSLVYYVNNKTKVKIICPIHGIFEQRPDNHLRQNCPICNGGVRMTKDFFIQKSNEIHNNFYDYSLVDYVNNKTKVKIICPLHGVFEQSPDKHLINHGCVICNGGIKSNKDIFIQKSNEIHNNFYDYSLVDYVNNKTKVKIICPLHGIFEQTPKKHLIGQGCYNCYIIKNIKETNLFIEEANLIHNNFYDYSLVNYVNNKIKVKIICPIHGIFEQTPNSHLSNTKCYKCSNISRRLKSLKRIEFNMNNNYQINPNFNKKACELFDKISLTNDINIQHAMNGGEFNIKELGYWVDGYDPVNNVVYEYDEKYHKSKKQQEKDLNRQNEIIDFLKCSFIRIKD